MDETDYMGMSGKCIVTDRWGQIFSEAFRNPSLNFRLRVKKVKKRAVVIELVVARQDMDFPRTNEAVKNGIPSRWIPSSLAVPFSKTTSVRL